ncbi:glycogen debranching N-terminal domain-containing protein [Streptomyces radicis]|uniref:Aminotransferase n=1 Tax=Streptomyces radicis TaxID=1750517 RepID=A0A3A9X195_9ACTN|nr:glycogen debranching N-terminal domain-containing protein [Streptomyces radicis]RKN12227.1 aminotransferase [Streptomyces radicis]RKN26097.1 aminotransferase [Streptomyces radicis]
MTTGHCLLVNDGTFLAVGPSGDITGERGAHPHGLFARDARHLSRWQLTVDGSTPTVLMPAESTGASATSVLTPPGSRAEAPALTVFREQRVSDGGLVERIRLSSNRGAPCDTLLALTVDADFADQFELRSDHRWYEKPHAVRTRSLLPDGVEFGYRRREWHSRTAVTAEPAPDAVEETGSGARRLCWRVELPPHGSAELTLRVVAHPYGAPESAAVFPDDPAPDEVDVPEGWPELARACAQGLADLTALRMTAVGPEGEPVRVPAAGVPWFLTLLGRHAAIASLFALSARPATAAATLLALAAAQATGEDADRLAQPGKIVHELRHGELAHFGQVPYGRYYGSVDSTPLFLVLLGAHAEATGDDKLAHRLERNARAAVDWMFHSGGLAEHGYLLYRADEGGLANQSWKDSPGAICRADGTPAKGVITAASAQGYAYDALRRTARVARSTWDDPRYADRLDAAADALRARFLADFWLAEQDFPALALDGEGERVDALGSDAGHLLWTGILDEERGRSVGRRLLSPAFFTGWGVRTLAAGQEAYHPLSYHRGSVWPHDSAIAALGLARYGLHEEAATLARGLLAMAERHAYRMPEVIAGYARAEHPDPVPYPHACSPQAWAAASPLALRTAVSTVAAAAR